jgi:hypothetical protein
MFFPNSSLPRPSASLCKITVVFVMVLPQDKLVTYQENLNLMRATNF